MKMIRRITFVVLAAIIIFATPRMSFTEISLSATAEQVRQPVGLEGTFSQGIAEPTAIRAIFPDIALAEAIRVALNKETIASLVRQQNLDTITELTYRYPEEPIRSLAGIDYLRNLTTLDLSGNAIQDMTILGTMAQLRKVSLPENKIKDLLPLTRLVNLTHFNLDQNEVVDIMHLDDLKKLEQGSLAEQRTYDYALVDRERGDSTYARCYAKSHYGLMIPLYEQKEPPTSTVRKCLGSRELMIDKVPEVIEKDFIREYYWRGVAWIGSTWVLFSGTEEVRLFEQRKISDVFPDPVFAEVIRQALNKLDNAKISYKENADTSVTAAELAQIKELNWAYPAEDKKIKSIEGLCRLRKVREVDFSGNAIASWDEFCRLFYINIILVDNNIRDLDPLAFVRARFKIDLTNNCIRDFHRVLDGLVGELILDGNAITDISELQRKNWGYLREVSVRNQRIHEHVLQTTPLLSRNTVRNADNTLAPPLSISDDGAYNAEVEMLSWDVLPPGDQVNVNYTWEQDVQIPFQSKLLPGAFSGIYQITAVKPYTARFQLDGADYVQPQAIIPYGQVPPPVRPVKAGYTFIGWYTEPEAGEQWQFATAQMPEADLTLYARFARNMSSVTYNDGISEVTYEVAYGGLLEAPERPTQPGKTFIGWFTDPLRGRQWNFATDVVIEEQMTLYARFLVSRYTVIYYNELGASPPMQRVTYGDYITRPPDPIAEGYRFLGWFTDPVNGEQWDFVNDTVGTNNVSLYARWEKIV